MPSVSFPLDWSCFKTICTRKPGRMWARLVPGLAVSEGWLVIAQIQSIFDMDATATFAFRAFTNRGREARSGRLKGKRVLDMIKSRGMKYSAKKVCDDFLILHDFPPSHKARKCYNQNI
jgi:hypothetical protein